MDSQRLDNLARSLGARKNRRQTLAMLGGAAAAAIPITRASAGGQPACSMICPTYSYGYAYGDTCTANLDFVYPVAIGDCLAPEVVCIPDITTDLGIGNGTVNCSVTSNPYVNCQFGYSVYDLSDLVLTCPADISIIANEPTSVPFGDPVLATECGYNYGSNANCDATSGDVFNLGTTLVTCTAILPSGKGQQIPTCSFNITLTPEPATATPTEPATATPTEPPQAGPTSVPTEVPATEVPATEVPTAVDPTSIPADPTATTAPVTQLPNTGAGSNGSGAASKLIPVAAVGAGAALLARLGLRKQADTEAVE